jgi:hypothetical protein
MNGNDHQTDLDLSVKDAAALDALMESGLNASGVPANVERRRVSRILSLLGLLRAGRGADPALVDVTLARIARYGETPITSADPVLTEDDQEAFDALVMSGFDAARVPATLRDRARKQEALLGVLRAPTVIGGEELLERTLAKVQDHISSGEDRLKLETVRARRSSGLRLADLVSVAAVILIGFGVLFPVLTSMREQSRRALCKSNLGATALGMSTYAGANKDALPVNTASLAPGGTWWDVGNTHSSNSSNLYTLARAGYVPLADLACPGNPAAPTAKVVADAQDWRKLEEVSYSYQIMFGPHPVWRSAGPAVILADRSPVVLRAIRGEAVDPCSNAPNHACEGQHLLRTDGTVTWATSPILPNGDNIWLPRAIEVRLQQLMGKAPLRGNETPSSADDTFLGP